ncbi:MAG: hypothetical protein GX494_11395 [Clostridiaceae bacterium]|nr:hypothetical protein [Clostridiaceae bacterium]
MTQDQAEILVDRLKNACVFHRFDEPGVYLEYARIIAQYDYDRMKAAIDEIIEEDSRNVPAISLLIKKYKGTSNAPKGQVEVKSDEYCAVCDDKGFVLMKEKQSDTGLTYEFVLYCPFCPVGRSWAYDGRNISDKKHRSPYYVPPVTEYFGDEGIQALREANMKKRRENIDVKRPVEKAVQSIGKEIPDGWQYDTIGDLPF